MQSSRSVRRSPQPMQQQREPFAELKRGNLQGTSGTPSKTVFSPFKAGRLDLEGALGGESAPDSGSPLSIIRRDAANVIKALDLESPNTGTPGSQRRGGLGDDLLQSTEFDSVLINRLASEVARHSGRASSCSADELRSPEFGSALINRLASEVARYDSAAAWEQVETLRQELGLKDAQLADTQQALQRLQRQCQQQQQQLKQQAPQEELGAQLAAVRAAQEQAAALRAAIEARDVELAAAKAQRAAATRRAEMAEAALAAAQAQLEDAGRERELLLEELEASRAFASEQAEVAQLARLELEEVQQEANARMHQLQDELWAADARLQVAEYGATPGYLDHPDQVPLLLGQASEEPGPAQELQISPAHSSPMSDVFGSPQPAGSIASSPGKAVFEVQGHRQPLHGQQGQQQEEEDEGSVSFQFRPHTSEQRTGRRRPDDGAVTSPVKVPDAGPAPALVARTLRRGGAQGRLQVQEVSHDLQELKHSAAHVHAQLAETPPPAEVQPSPSRPRRSRSTPPSRSAERSSLPLEEQCRFAQLEERQLREEVETLNSRCEHLNLLLLKANQAMKILHYKLQKERKTVTRLQDEKCELQGQLLANKAGSDGITQQSAELEQELQQSRRHVEELLQQKGALEGLQAEQARLLHEAQERSQQLAQQLEQQQRAAAEKAAELQQLSGLAHSSTEELLQAREALQAERAKADGLRQEKAELNGRVEALQETLKGLGQSDGMLLQLTEEKAALQLQLRDAQADAQTARASLEGLATYVSELEQACQSLRQQLDAALAQQGAAHAAVEAAADRVQQLTDSHEQLEARLALAEQEWEAAAAAAQEYAMQLQRLGQERTCLEGLGRVEAGARQHAPGQQGGTEQHQDLGQGLQAESSVVRSLGSKVGEGEGQQALGNICDVTGLIDAIQSLQHRNRLLQQDLEHSQARHTELQAALDAKSRQHAEALADLHRAAEAARQQQAAALAEAQRAAAASVAQLEQERAALAQQLEEVQAKLRTAEGEAQQTLQELQSKVADSQSALQALTQERGTWEEERTQLQGQLAAAKKSLALAQSKLVLAKQRESQLKAASEQFAGLQSNLKKYLEECEATRALKEQAEARCAELEAQLTSLAQNDDGLRSRMLTVQEESSQLREANLSLEERLARLQLSHSQLEQQLAASASLAQQLSHLETERQSSAEWFDALHAELADKAAEVARLQEQLADAQRAGAETASALAAAEASLADAQAAQRDADLGWKAASAALASTEQQLGEARAQCEAAAGREREAGREAAAAAAARDRAEKRSAELEGQRAELQAECTWLRQQLDSVCSASDTTMEELRKQSAHLVRELEEAVARAQASQKEHEAQLGQLRAEVAACQSGCEELQGELEAANAARAEHAQRAQQLQQQCMELTAQLAAAQGQQQQLSERLAAAEETERAARQTADEVQQHVASLEQRLEGAAGASAQQAEQLGALKQQLRDAEERAQQAQQAAAAAEDSQALGLRLEEAEGQLQRLQAQDEVKLMLQDVSAKLEAQMEVLQRVGEAASNRIAAAAAAEEAEPASPLVGTHSSVAAAPAAAAQGAAAQAFERRELLVQALEKLEALQAENQQLWRMVEVRLAHAGPAGAMRAGLLPQSRPGREPDGDMAAKLAAAQASIQRLQQTVDQLRRAQRQQAQPQPNHPQPLQQQQQQQPSGAASSIASHGSGSTDYEAWQVEKRALKAICKLALAVTMDQVGGRQEAAPLAEELAPAMHAHEAVLHQLGLFKVWRSLHKLASTPRPAQFAPAPAQQQQQQQAATALQTLVDHYQSRCSALEAQVAGMESAAARWQGQADGVEAGLALLKFQLEDLLAEVRFVLEDFGPHEWEAGGTGCGTGEPGHQLSAVVAELSKGLRRLLRKYRTLSSLLAASSSEATSISPWEERQPYHQHAHPQQQQQRQPKQKPRAAAEQRPGRRLSSGKVWPVEEEEGENCSLAANQRRGGLGGAAALQGQGVSSQLLVAETRGKAASIAEKLDRMLTPHSRAAIHGGSTRFVDPAGGHQAQGTAGIWDRVADGAARWAASCAGGWQPEEERQQQGQGEEDVPLRQLYSGGAGATGGAGLAQLDGVF